MEEIKVRLGKQPKVNGIITRPHSGSNGRSIYIARTYVLKVDDRGYHHNDLVVWQRIEPEDRKYFVPTLAQGTWHKRDWSVQPFVKLENGQTAKDRILVDRLTDKYGLSDIHDDNWAKFEGRPIIFDYGLGAE
jgi:hypothetical protein